MKKIREFAILCGTSSKTLRFYDSIGLLEAEYTDPANGYRYYSDDQKEQYEAISTFKQIGFTLDEIKREILGKDDECVLELLREKLKELSEAEVLCRRQIRSYEKAIRRRSAPEPGKFGVRLIREEGKVIVGDGVTTRVFVCPEQSLDTCADVMEGLFGTKYITGLSADDLEETDEDRKVMTQVMEGTLEELSDADWAAMFEEVTENVREVFAMILIPMGIQMNCEGVKEWIDGIMSRVTSVFPIDSRIVWGASIDNDRRDTVQMCVMGVY